MLVVIPAQPYGRLGTVLSALIVVFSLIGLSVHRDFYAGRKRKDFFCFYTNLSNLIVLVYFALIAPRLYASASLRPFIPSAEFSVMMSIMLTFSIFHTLIFPSVRIAADHAAHTREYRIAVADNFLIHYLVPWLVFLYWLLCSPQKQALSPADALYWTALPLGYAAFIFLRARIKGTIEEAASPYPYPFLDIGVFGVRRVLRICAQLYGLCILAGTLVIAMVHILKL